MAERRMFAKSIIDSDDFLDMPASTQNLYFHLSMRADDDGFVNSPQKIMRMVSCSKNDFDMLVFKKYVITFESGICVIKHWKIHNYLRSDRYTPSMYVEERSRIFVDDSKMYTTSDTDGIPLGIPDGTPIGIPVVDVGKVRVVKNKKDKNIDVTTVTVFIKPTVEEVKEYCEKRNNVVDPEQWFDHYTANGWKVGKSGIPMKDWQASVRTWERNGRGSSKVNFNGAAKVKTKKPDYSLYQDERNYDPL